VPAPLAIAEVASTGQPEPDIADCRAGGLRRCDEPVVAVAAPTAAVASGRKRAANPEGASVTPLAVNRRVGARNLLPITAIGRLLQFQADGGVGGRPYRVAAQLWLSVEFEGDRRPGRAVYGDGLVQRPRIQRQAVGEMPDRCLGCRDGF